MSDPNRRGLAAPARSTKAVAHAAQGAVQRGTGAWPSRIVEIGFATRHRARLRAPAVVATVPTSCSEPTESWGRRESAAHEQCDA